MIRLGVLTETDRVELIRGEIVAKIPIGPKPSGCVKGSNRRFNRFLGGKLVVGVQDPVRLPDSGPGPGISLVRPRDDRDAAGHPQPRDILLSIEVSDSTLADDRDIGRPRYAEAGIAEFWLVTLVDECLAAYRHARPDGRYPDVRVPSRGESTDIAALPGMIIAVDEIS